MSRSAYIGVGGGIDMVSSPRKMKPGAALSCVNYECPVTGGYRRVDGYAQVGPAVPGKGPALGVATFADHCYAIREDTEGGSATLYRLSEDESAWETAGTGLAVGRYEFDEGNAYATETGRCLYGVGGGHPFELMAVPNGATTYNDLQELIDALYGTLPNDVSLSADEKKLTITDAQGRAISSISINDKSDSELVTTADVAEASTEGDPTSAEIDLASSDINSIGTLRFTIGDGGKTTMSIPELIGPFRILDQAQPGAQWISLHQNHLFLGYSVGSLQFSSIGDPASWNAATGGAGEIGVGQRLNGIIEGVGGVLHATCQNSVQTLRGSSALDFNLEVTSPGAGGRAFSLQSLVLPYFVGERGISTLEATQKYGDFAPMQPGRAVEPLFTRGSLADRVVASSVSRDKSQYRVWFNDKTGLFISSTGITRVDFPDQVAVTHSGEMESGKEHLLFADDEGKVYQLDSGASFNGKPVRAFLTLAFNDLGAPSSRKRFRRTYWDVRSGSDARMWIQPDFDYGDNETGRPRRNPIDFMLGGGLWDVDLWNQFKWSVPTLGQEPLDISGTGTSINFSIFSESDAAPHEILGYDLQFDVRRNRRG